MEFSPTATIVVCVVMFLVVCALWWLRYYEKKLIAQQVRRSTQTYMGRMAMEVYHIHYHPRIETPPPSFSKALKCPKLVFHTDDKKEDTPPPTYSRAVDDPAGKIRKPLTDIIVNIPDVHKTSNIQQMDSNNTKL